MKIELIMNFPLTDAGNAERLEAMLSECWKFLPAINKWIKWTGQRWEEQDEPALYVAAAEALRKMADEIDLLPRSPDKGERERRNRILNWLEKSENAGKIKNAAVFLRDLLKDDYTEYDSDPFLLNCQNGTLNLTTGILKPHDKADKLMKICSVPYIESPTSTLWAETVEQILPDPNVRHWLQKFVGSCMTGSTQEEKFIIAYGPGGRGKGTFWETIAAVLADFKTVLPIDILLTSGITDTGNGPTPELAKLPGKRLVLSSESGKGRRLDEAKVKLLTGGDVITARRLQCDPFEFRPAFKLVLQTNYLPSLTDSLDLGIQRRTVIIPFTANLDTDIKLKSELLKPENLIACLSWCVTGCRDWINSGLGDVPPAAKAAAEAYYRENDLLGQWLEERTEKCDGCFLLFDKALSDFNEWLTVGGTGTRYQRKGFAEAMERHGKARIRKNTGNGYPSLCLRF